MDSTARPTRAVTRTSRPSCTAIGMRIQRRPAQLIVLMLERGIEEKEMRKKMKRD
jgi:hypothetical protein